MSIAAKAFATALLFSSGPQVFACAACFGQSDSRMAQGMNMGIFALLLVITCVLAGVAGFFIYLARRSSQMAEPMPQGLETISQNSTNV
jgi:hypothetical protein